MKADFVVIGAGSAGCVTATRLAQAGFSTLLLEAGGPDRHPLIHIPAGVRYLFSKPEMIWPDATCPDPATGNRSVGWPHGRVLGGSGSINGMIFVRGSRADFDHWAQAGATGWDFDAVLPHFRDLETYAGPASTERGTSGPLHVEDARLTLPLTRAFVAAAEAAGHRRLADINTADPEGVGFAQMNRRVHRRWSSARAFLPLGGPNLRIVTGFHASRLTFDGTTCTGVEGLLDGTPTTITAGREVVLACGAVGTPHLMQLSGLGPAGALAAAGIPLTRDLPQVGADLMDHYGVRLAWRVRGARTLNELARMPRLGVEVLRWLFLRRGALTTGVTTAMVFARSRDGLAAPDLQLLFSPSSFDRNRYGALERQPGMSVTVSLAHPHSRGRVLATSADPAERPRIEANYLADPADLATLLRGIPIARRILAQSPIAQHVKAQTLPATDDPAALEDFVRTTGVSVFHPAGTCAIGRVVDRRLRVTGIGGLRIADASVMPALVSGNLNATVMMIGHKAAAMIAEDHGRAP